MAKCRTSTVYSPSGLPVSSLCTWRKRLSPHTTFISWRVRILQRANTITFVSLSARSFVLIAALLPSAGATTITILPAAGIIQAAVDASTWLTTTFGSGTTADPFQPQITNVTPGKSNGVVKLELLTSFQSLYFFLTGVEGKTCRFERLTEPPPSFTMEMALFTSSG